MAQEHAIRVEIELDEEQEKTLRAVAEFWGETVHQATKRVVREGLWLEEETREALQAPPLTPYDNAENDLDEEIPF